MLPNTPERVPAHSPDAANRAIQRGIEANVRYYGAHPGEIDERLAELDAEWDIERMLEANAAAFALTGTVLAALGSRRWLALPAAVTTFLLQHALQGWCPPLPLLRRLGFRTMREIDKERYALKALRGDFDRLGQQRAGEDAAQRALRASPH